MDIDTLEFEMPAFDQAEKLTLTVKIEGTTYKNEYPLWVYPKDNQPETPDNVYVHRRLDTETMKKLAQGQKVLLMPEPDTLGSNIEGFFASDFWCYPIP